MRYADNHSSSTQMTKVNFMSSVSLQHGREDGNKAEEVSLNETMLDPGPLQSTQTRGKAQLLQCPQLPESREVTLADFLNLNQHILKKKKEHIQPKENLGYLVPIQKWLQTS